MKKYVVAYYLFAQISGMWLCSIFGSLAAGLWIDKNLGTAAWFLLVLVVLGLVFAVYSIYRTVTQINQVK